MATEHYHAHFVTDHFYHIYNRANTDTDKLFYQEKNYTYFLKKFDQYLSDYLEVWAYCLMPNHFHFLVKVKNINMLAQGKNLETVVFNAIKKIDIITLNKIINIVKNFDIIASTDSINAIKKIDMTALANSINAIKKLEMTFNNINTVIEEQFRKFFIGYAKAINKQESRRGSLFQNKFKRIHIDNDTYLMTLIHYIHYNPIHHYLTPHIQNWHYSSYNTLIHQANTKLMRKEVLELFGNKERFIEFHKMLTDYNKIRHYIVDD